MSEDQRNATTASSMFTTTVCPSPVFALWYSAAVTACAQTWPVSLSGTMVRTSRGRSESDPPCTLARPETAWISGS